MPSSLAADHDQRKYFASLELPKLLPLLFERIDSYYTHVNEAGLLPLWRASHMASYSGFYVGGRMNEVGPNGKFTSLEANEYRNLMTHVLNMITAQKSQPEGQARNMDHQSQQQVTIANGLATTISETKQLERLRQDVADKGLSYGEGWGVPIWNKDLGEIHATDLQPHVDENGEPILDEQGQPATNEVPLHVGDLEINIYHPLDVVRDTVRTKAGDDRWITTRGYANRYDLMASNPRFADRISRLPSAAQTYDGKRPRLYEWYNLRKDACDDVPVWTFMHEKTPAMPSGRIVVALAPDLAIVDDDLPYRKLPHVRWSAADIEGTIFGYSLFFDLLALQQGVNAGVSAIATRMAAFGLPTVAGSVNTALENLGDGMTCLTVGPGEALPQLIDFSNIPPGLVEFIKMLRDLMSTYAGINSVARGQAEGGVTAASALALLEARAVQFVALSQKADIHWCKETYTTSLHHYQDHAVGEVLVKMVGQGNKSRVESYTADKFQSVSGYKIEIGNALQSTIAGKMQLVEGMIAAKIHLTANQYIQVATKGSLDPIAKGPQSEEELIAAENEMLSNGQPVPVIISQHHPNHIREHCVVIDDPGISPNEPRVQATLAHIQEHEAQWEEATITRPALLAAKGIPPAPMPVQPMAPGMAPPGGPGAPPPHGGPPGPAGKPSAQPQGPTPGGEPPHVEQARPAKNPMTGAPNPHAEASA